MTTGSVIDDKRADVTEKVILPDGTVYSSTARKVGFKYTKTWTGTDYPATKPPTAVYVWRRRSDGKLFRKRYRTDAPKRRFTDDHPYSCTISMHRDSLMDWDFYQYGSLSESRKDSPSFQNWREGFVASGEWDSNDDIALIGKLREAVAGSDFNMGVFLGEGREALKMIADSATRIMLASQSLKRGDLLGALKHLGTKKMPQNMRPFRKGREAVTSNWLELQYGWKPLLKDTQGAAEFLAKTLNFPMVQDYKVSRRKPLTLEKANVGASLFTAWQAKGDTRARLIARLSEVNPYQLAGLLDPASVAWELLPYSFVVDWFIPIGNYLAARSLASALTGTFVKTVTRRVECRAEGFQDRNAPPNLTVYTKRGSSDHYEVSVVRTVSTTLSVPLPGFKTLDKVASWQHCANAVALLSQRFWK